jgi:hypothetical protein
VSFELNLETVVLQTPPNVLISASISSLVLGGVDGKLNAESMTKDPITPAYGA